MQILYNIILMVAALIAAPYYAFKIIVGGKYRKSIARKFGLNPPDIYNKMKGKPRIWIHAVSVGEVTAAAPIIASIRQHFPKACLILSTSTETGQEMAHRIATSATAIFYYPLDLTWIVRKVIRQVQPDIFIMVETELWPNFIRICRQEGARVLMVNGRISPRSFRNYFFTRFFWKSILVNLNEAGVISETDAERMKAIGMPPDKVRVLGNAKYDSLAAEASPIMKENIAKKLAMKEGERIFVAGSTHEGEEKIVLNVYRQLLQDFPDLRLILVPRHIERGPEAVALARDAGFTDILTVTEIQDGRKPAGEQIIVVDVIGELFKVYSLATLVYCGGSLVPRGGQNILEPAAWGKVIFYGPSMDDFRDEKELLESAGAGIQINNGQELFQGIHRLMSRPQELMDMGEKGRDAVISNMGAAKRYAAMIRMHIKS